MVGTAARRMLLVVCDAEYAQAAVDACMAECGSDAEAPNRCGIRCCLGCRYDERNSITVALLSTRERGNSSSPTARALLVWTCEDLIGRAIGRIYRITAGAGVSSEVFCGS